MQKYCTELTERLLKSLDKEYNVVDMGAVVDIISALEKTTVTKEVLEITRLGKYINELRRKTNNDTLAKRAKDLVRRWRDMVLPSAHSTPQPTPADTAPPALNGAKPHSPALRNFKPHSPALRGLKPQSPLLKDATSLKVLSPALSVNSDHTRSPNWSSNKQSITSTSNCKISSSTSPALCSSSQNHMIEAVPRTHSSNKRLRKEENKERPQSSPEDEPIVENEESLIKKQRLNGENISGNINSQVPSPMLKERTSSNRLIGLKTSSDDSGPRKRGRKKGSKSTKHQAFLEDHVKEKLASISRNPKLKTTQELLADLQARGTNCNAVGSNPLPSQSTTEPPSMEDVLRGSSSEQMSKYLRCSQKNSNHHRSSTSEASVSKAQMTRSKSTENSQEISVKSCQESHEDISDVGLSICHLSPQRDLTVEEILAKLPPLDPNSIDWSESDTPESTEGHNDVGCSSPRKVTVDDVERLHSQCVEGLNGNFQPRIWSVTHSDGDEHSNKNEDNKVSSGLSNTSGANSVYRQTDGEEFREWHQVLSRSSHEDQPLHILPYVIID